MYIGMKYVPILAPNFVFLLELTVFLLKCVYIHVYSPQWISFLR